ncbi:MAG: hypothetical protein PHT03_04525 [Bacilli bacterium]|nr:hypothetical protein [Bacilli bacterium]
MPSHIMVTTIDLSNYLTKITKITVPTGVEYDDNTFDRLKNVIIIRE